ncbi:MAG: hypothetical protein AB1333_02835 [Patescibacteria group bacterium]
MNQKKTGGKSILYFIIGQTVIIIIAVGVMYWWQVYITDVLIGKNVETIQTLNKQLMNFERQIYLLKQESQPK